ncbi:MAG: ACP S-malonyltransferase [Candidatus Dormibacteria bacterium]
MTLIALCFPGQGSQVAGMAEGLLELPLAHELIDEAQQCGLDLASALQGNDASLRATAVAQPALLFVETLLAAEIPGGLEVAGVAGHSVGEYAAAVAAGALAPRQAMRLVIARCDAMAAMAEGMMTALLGIDEAAALAVCEQASSSTGAVVVVANVNAPGQVVISGAAIAVTAATALATERGARRAVPLNVSGAFHSPLMESAAEDFAAHLDAATIGDPSVPIVCNVDGEAVTDAAGLRDRLRRQLTSPVRWTDCVARLTALGAEALVEVGPGSVLSGLARRIAPEVPALPVSSLEAAHDLSAALSPSPRPPTA